jgi:hypothetical protein
MVFKDEESDRENESTVLVNSEDEEDTEVRGEDAEEDDDEGTGTTIFVDNLDDSMSTTVLTTAIQKTTNPTLAHVLWYWPVFEPKCSKVTSDGLTTRLGIERLVQT